MTTRTTPWPPGRPNWADLVTTDLGVARAFYAGLLGWDLRPRYEIGTDLERDDALMARVEGLPVAGILQMPPAILGRSTWSISLATADIEATLAAVVAAGGVVLTPPTAVGDEGVFAAVRDPAGAVVRLWEAHERFGTELWGVPGALALVDQLSHDFERSKRFYSDVFGYTYHDVFVPGGQYVAFRTALDECDDAGGIAELTPESEAEGVVAHWRVCFQVPDADVAAAYVRSNGGTVDGILDSAYGRIVLVVGPTGEELMLVGPAPERLGL